MKQNQTPKPKWSAKTSFLVAIAVVAIISILVLCLAQKSIWFELEIITFTLSLLIFSYFYYILYHGVRFVKGEKLGINWKKFNLDDISYSPIQSNVFTEAGAESGLIGAILGFLLDIVVSILFSIIIAYLLWLGINVLLVSITALFLPLFYLFRRSVRYIVAKGRYCYQKPKQSFRFALQATLYNSIVVYAVLFSGHFLWNLQVV